MGGRDLHGTSSTCQRQRHRLLLEYAGLRGGGRQTFREVL